MAVPPPPGPTPPTTPAPPPPPPGPGASRHEWHEWRRRQRDYMRAHWMQGGGYGPWGWGWYGAWGWFWGVALVLIGGYYLLSNLGLLNGINGNILWPILVIALGVFLLIRRGRGWW